MRTSGAEDDLMLVAVPMTVLIALSMYWLGGWRECLLLLDRAVLDGLAWVRALWL